MKMRGDGVKEVEMAEGEKGSDLDGDGAFEVEGREDEETTRWYRQT